MASEERFNELDGMRGIATILVISYHIFKRGDYFTTNAVLHFITSLTLYGWYALDTFFVLSGFLITGILLRTKEEKDYFKNFYVRRSLRVFPLYYFVLALILFLMPKLDPDYVAEIPKALPYYLFYQQNWFHFLTNVKGTEHLSVTWSLAIEEQFYLLFPFLVYFTRKETLAKVAGGIIFVSILARVLSAFLWTDVDQMTNFYFYNTFTRFEEISFGILIAVAFTYPDWKAKLSRIAMPVFLIAYPALLITEAVTSRSIGIPHPAYGNVPLTVVGYTLASVFAAALIVVLTTHDRMSFIRRFFRNKVLTFFGDHSYSIYLFHMPIGLTLLDYLWRNDYRGWQIYFLYIGLTFGITIFISILTWNFLEKPMLGLKKYFEYKEPAK
ncbi:MAG TPA: acyltransferase [Anaerolineales bacterium]|nr:acyltransferase [Anaerolineales bacterium]HMV96914.1 acyltransferase [Anaerolineales bacterium]HMX19745.1 acyltransferase [Anaerolineales bacterium]HMX76364.1 acyltransferase [Anaerolineales bacterium]HMZ44755.1 acyltransferase [Anaerolineales bacterium]